MATPATTGVLRTTIESMQIGDYIVCNYSAASGAIGTFSNWGGVAGTEIPVAGSATPSGTFYFIKADKGLLIADRVLQSSISWDTLNTGKIIQGKRNNWIPVMTSNTAPSGVASASSTNAGNDPYKAFDGLDDVYGWATASGLTTGWLQYDFPNPVIVTDYSIKTQNASTSISRSPKNWTFEAWNGTQWVVLDTRTNVTGWIAATAFTFSFTNTTSYPKYRINITLNNGDASYLTIGEMEMSFCRVRSLTGGCSYADANGNSSSSNSLHKGAFPTNNEWDKYVVSFPANMTQTGKTLDDVFHWSGCCSIVQDTPINGIPDHQATPTTSSNLNRAWRGYLFNEQFSFAPSANTYTTLGFRPVFEYQEG